jgi:hypothetical protein
MRLAEAPEPDSGSAAITWTQEAGGCAMALISPEAVTFGPCDGPLLPVRLGVSHWYVVTASAVLANR